MTALAGGLVGLVLGNIRLPAFLFVAAQPAAAAGANTGVSGVAARITSAFVPADALRVVIGDRGDPARRDLVVQSDDLALGPHELVLLAVQVAHSLVEQPYDLTLLAGDA